MCARILLDFLEGGKEMRKLFIVVLAITLMAGFVYAKGVKGTAPEAVKMVEQAVALIIDAGGEKAFPQISAPRGPFVDRDLYVYVVEKHAGYKRYGR